MTAANDSNSENNHDPEKYSPTNKDSLFILYGCDKKITQNPHLVEDLADEAREQTGAKLVKKIRRDHPGGITSVYQLVEESHITVTSFEENNVIIVKVDTCGDTQSLNSINVILERAKPRLFIGNYELSGLIKDKTKELLPKEEGELKG